MKASFNTAYGTAEIRLSYVQEDRLAASVAAEQPMVKSAEAAVLFFRECVAAAADFDPEVETFAVIMLDRRNRAKGWKRVSTGTATAALAHPREIFRAAVVASASAVICLHNHPSGDPSPSAADILLTRQVREAARIIDIAILDHVIIGRPNADPLGRGYYSFREAGLV